MRIWCIKIGNVFKVLHFNPCVEASADGQLVPEGLYSPVARYFGTCFKYEYELNCQGKSKFCKFIWKRRIISLRHSSILRRTDLAQFHGTLFGLHPTALSVFIFRGISNFFDLNITEETWVVEMHIWCIKIGNLLALHWIVQTLLILTFIVACHAIQLTRWDLRESNNTSIS